MEPTATPAAGTPAASTPASPVVSTPSISTPAQAAPAGGQQPAGTPAQQAGWDYKTDPRWGADKLFKTEADIIQAYHKLEDVHEKKYKPSFEKLSSIEKKFNENKLSVDQLDEYLKNYLELQSPENPKNQMWQFLNELIDDDLTAQDYQNSVLKIKEEKLARKYPGMTAEMRKQAIERDKKLAELENWKSGFEREKNVNTELQNIQNSEKAIRDLCVKKGFEFTDNIKAEFWKYCQEEVKAGKMTTSQMPYAFSLKYGDELDKAYENKIKSGMLENQAKTKATTVSFAKKPAIPGTGKESLADRLRKFYAPQPPATS